MSAKTTKTIKTMQSQSGHPIGVFFPDMSKAQVLSLEAAANMQFPPNAEGADAPEGGIWWMAVPSGKTVLMIGEPMSVAEAEDINLVRARAWPIVGPIYYPVAFDDGDYNFLVPDGTGFDVPVVPNRNNGGAA